MAQLLHKEKKERQEKNTCPYLCCHPEVVALNCAVTPVINFLAAQLFSSTLRCAGNSM